MASLFNTKISDTYPGLIKTLDNAAISASLKELTDGSGNQSGLFINTAGDFKASGILEFGSLKDTGENITITKFVDEADGIANNDNDTTIPTSAAVVDYVASRITLEDLDFSGDTGTGSVDLDSQVFAITGTTNQIITAASGQSLSLSLPTTIHTNLQGNVTGNITGIGTLSDGSTAVTQTDGDNSTKIATTAYVDTAIQGHDTLAEVLVGGNTTGGTNISVSANDDITFTDTSKAVFGDGNDLQIYHTSNSIIYNTSGDLVLEQTVDDRDIIFKSDNGSGGTDTYFKLWGLISSLAVYKDMLFVNDGNNGKLKFGASQDLQIYHDGSNSFISDTGTGDLRILGSVVRLKSAGDENMVVGVENAGVTLYYDAVAKLTTTSTGVTVTGTIISDGLSMGDGEQINLGSGNDLQIFHNGTDGSIRNFAGDLILRSAATDKDIIFQADDGSGNATTYLYLDGSSTQVKYDVNLKVHDNKKIIVGDGDDLQIEHTGTDSYIQNNTGVLNIVNNSDNQDIKLWSDDGNGGVTTYFQLDGSHTKMIAYKDIHFDDNIKATFGSYASPDLQIYHDGNHSRIKDSGTGHLTINATDFVVNNSADTKNMLQAIDGGEVKLYYNSSKKFETTNTGVSVTGVITTGDITISDNNPNLTLSDTSTTNLIHEIKSASDKLQISADSNDVDAGTKIEFLIDGTEVLDLSDTTATFAGSVTIAQNLTVNGTTTTVNTEHFNVEDPLISMAKDNAANSVDIGFYGRYNDGTNRYLGLYADASDSNTFNLFSGLTVEPTTTVDKTATGYNSANLILSSLYVNDYVYHNGDNDSYLGFSAADNFILRTGASTKIFADATNTYLYYNGNQKLRTTSSGVHITGGLTVGDSTEENPFGINIQDDRGDAPLGLLIHNQNTGTSADAKISFETQGSRDISIGIDRSDGNKFKISHSGNLGTNDFLTIDGSGNMVLGGTISSGAITSSASVIASGNSNSFGNTTTGALTASSISSSGSLNITGNSNSIGITTFTGNVTISDGNSPQLRVTDTTNTVTAKLMSDNTTGFVGTHTNHDLSFIINNNVKGTLDTSGNLGLNTNSPNHKLDVYAEDNVGLRIHRPNSDLSSDNPIGIGFSTRSDGNTSTTDTRSGLFSYYNGNLFLSASTSSITSDPYASKKLEITSAGNIVLSGNLMPQSENNFNIGSSSIRWEDLYVDDGYIRDLYIDEYIYHNGDTDTYIRFTADTMTFRTAGDDAVIIDSNRRVGIGVTPIAKFHVKDNNSAFTMQEYGGNAAIFLDGSNGDFAGGDYFHIDASADRMGLGGYGGGAPKLQIDSTGITHIMGATASTNNSLQLAYNSTAGSAEISAKSTGGNTHFEFYTSASGTTTEKLRINSNGSAHFKSTGTDDNLIIETSDTGTSAAPDLTLYRNSSSPADNDDLGTVNWKGENSAGATHNYALIMGTAMDVTDNTEDGRLDFRTSVNGALNTRLHLTDTFRSFVNVGIGKDPSEVLDIKASSGDTRIRLDADSGSDTEIKFFNDGTAQYTIGHDDATDDFVIGGENVDAPMIMVNKSGDLTVRKNNGSPILNMLRDGNNPSANTLLHHLNFEVDYSGTHQDWGGIEHRTTSSATRTKLNLNVKSNVGNVETGLSIEGQASGKPIINIDGEILKGITSAVGIGGTPADANSTEIGNGYIILARDDTATAKQISFGKNGSEVGSIETTGSATAYNTSSDYRLKEDFKDFNGLSLINNINVYDFKWKTDESRSYGVKAHELQDVLPQAVSGKKDAEEMQSVDYSKIVPLLVKSIQELQEEVNELKQQCNCK